MSSAGPSGTSRQRSREEYETSNAQQQHRPDSSKSRRLDPAERAAKPAPEKAMKASPTVLPVQNKVISNYFRFNVHFTKDVYYMYSVTFDPQSLPLLSKFKILHKARKDGLFDIGKGNMYDGSNIIADGKLLANSAEIQGAPYFFQVHDPKTQQIYRVTVKFVRNLSNREITPTHLQLLSNTYYAAIRQMGFRPASNKQGENVFFDMEKKIELRIIRSFLVRGVRTVPLITEAGAFFNCDMKQRIIQNTTVWALIQQIGKDAAMRKLKNAVIVTPHNGKSYRLIDIDQNTKITDTFEINQPRARGSSAAAATSTAPQDLVRISYADYFLRHYQQVLKPGQCFVKARVKFRGGRKQGVLLPSDLCVLTGVEQADLSKIRRDLCVQPAGRLDFIQQHMAKVASSKSLSARGIHIVDAKPYIIQNAFQLVPETLEFGEQKQINVDGTGTWKRVIRETKAADPIPLTELGILFPRGSRTECDKFVRNMKLVCDNFGVPFKEPQRFEVNGDAEADYLRTLDGYRDRIRQIRDRKGVLFTMSTHKSIYKAIKQMLCGNDMPVLSQHVLTHSMQKDPVSVCSNILLSLQMKLGGAPWICRAPFKSTIMTVGIDVSHSQKSMGDSTGAFVASMNQNFTKFHTQSFYNARGNEIVTKLRQFMVAALDKFGEKNTQVGPNGQPIPGAPAGIIVYRDGVSEGEMQAVLDNEVQAIRQALADKGLNLPMAYIIVQKRCSQKFFLTDDQGKIMNPSPGLVIPFEIIDKDLYQFYLVSYGVGSQGCANPVRYTIIYNTTQLPCNVFASLTNKLAHQYYNFTAAVRLPLPLMMAHKASEFVGQVLKLEPSHRLQDYAYYM